MRKLLRGQTFNDGPYTYRIFMQQLPDGNSRLNILLEEIPQVIAGDLLIYAIGRLVDACKANNTQIPPLEVQFILEDAPRFGAVTKSIYKKHASVLENPTEIKALYSFAEAHKNDSLDLTELNRILAARISKANKTISIMIGDPLVDEGKDVAILTSANVTGDLIKDRHTDMIVPSLTVTGRVTPLNDVNKNIPTWGMHRLLINQFQQNAPIDVYSYDKFFVGLEENK
jgi:hypothetical protein